LIHHTKYLKGEHEYYSYLTQLLNEIEEYELIYETLKLYDNLNYLDHEEVNYLVRQITFYQETPDGIDYGFKVLFDCTGYVDGQLVESLSGHLRKVVVGNGVFTPEFEEELLYLKEGEEKDFSVRLPDDYPDENLANSGVSFHVKVHKVLTSMFLNHLDDIRNLLSENDYSSLNVPPSKNKNPVLYFLYLKSLDRTKLLTDSDLCLDLIDRYLEIGKTDQALNLSEHFVDDGDFKTKLVRILEKHRLCEVALDLYSSMEGKDYEIKLWEAICHFHLGRYDHSLKTLHEIYNKDDIRLLHYLREIYGIKNGVEKVRELEERILDLKIRTLLSKNK
jgi:hypothetical protein